MKRSRRLLIVLMVTLLALGSFSFVLAQDATQAVALEPVELTMWTTETEQPVRDLFDSLFKQWADQYDPGSTLTSTLVATEDMRNNLLAAGLAGAGMPDMFLGPNDPIGVYVDAGLIQSLDDKFDMSVFNGTIAAAQLGGQTYGIPVMSGNHLMLMYNKKYVEKAPDTWEELIATAKAIQQAHPDVQGLAYNDQEPFWLLPVVGGFGGSVFDADGKLTLNTQPWIDAYQFFADLKKSEIVPAECDYNCMDSLFKSGNVAMVLNGDWQIGTYEDVAQSPAVGKDNLGLAPWPKLANGQRPTPYTSGRFISIPVTTTGAKLDAILAWLKWMVDDQDVMVKYTIDLSRLPATKAGSELPAVQSDPILAASAAALATGIGMPANVELRCMWDSVKPNFQAAEAGSMTATDAAAAAQTAADTCVENFNVTPAS